jgi:hypothetical protein
LDPLKSCFLVTEPLSGATLGEWLHGGRERWLRAVSSSPPLVDRVSRALEIAASPPPPPQEESGAAGSDTILHSITGLLPRAE